MTNYINQTIAREHVAELIEQAEGRRLRGQLRRARRAERAERAALRYERRRWRGLSNSTLGAPHRIGLVGLR